MNLNKRLEKTFSQYKDYLSYGEVGDAFVSLAEIKNAIDNYASGSQLHTFWENTVMGEVDKINFTDVMDFVSKNLEQISRIISIGSAFNEDEMLLVLDKMMSLCLVVDFAEKVHFPINDENIGNTVIEMEEVFSQKGNIKDYQLVKNALGKTSLLPVKLSWIEINLK